MPDVLPEIEPWFLYMIQCDKGQLYTGISNDPERRFKEHQSNGAKCAKFLRGKQPLEKVMQIELTGKSLALRLEYRVKALSRAQKQGLIADNQKIEPMIELIHSEALAAQQVDAQEQKEDKE